MRAGLERQRRADPPRTYPERDEHQKACTRCGQQRPTPQQARACAELDLDVAPRGEPHRRTIADPNALEAATTEAEQHICSIETVDYRGVFGAPGTGQSWECRECGRPWVRWNANNELLDPAEGVHIQGPEDVV